MRQIRHGLRSIFKSILLDRLFLLHHICMPAIPMPDNAHTECHECVPSFSAFYWTSLYHPAHDTHIIAGFTSESPFSLDAHGTHLLHSVQEKNTGSQLRERSVRLLAAAGVPSPVMCLHSYLTNLDHHLL